MKMRQSHMYNVLTALKGNVKACVYTEPLWGIPYNLYIPYATIFMYRMGIQDVQIGLLLTIGMAIQVAAALFGGVITDKLGRRLTTLIFDLLSWSVPCLIWAFAQNFWWFLAAIMFNSMWQITNNSWNCLLVEDCEPSILVNVFTWVHISGQIAVFFAPLAKILVDQLTIVPAVRIFYLFSFVSMTAKFIILYFKTTETQVGQQRRIETAHVSIREMMLEYREVIRMMLRQKATLFLIAFLVLYNIISMIVGNFFGLYITEELQIADGNVAIFPMIKAIIILVFMLGFQNRLNRYSIKGVMGIGFGLFLVSTVLLMLAPAGSLWMIVVYIILQAVGLSLIGPRRDSMFVWFVDVNQRARVNGIIYVIMLAASAPFGYVIGALSSIGRMFPFALYGLLAVAGFVMVMASRTLNQVPAQEHHES